MTINDPAAPLPPQRAREILPRNVTARVILSAYADGHVRIHALGIDSGCVAEIARLIGGSIAPVQGSAVPAAAPTVVAMQASEAEFAPAALVEYADVAEFVATNVQRPTGWVNVNDMREAYLAWAKKHGLEPLGKKAYSKALWACGLRYARRRLNGTQERGWSGGRFRVKVIDGPLLQAVPCVSSIG